MRLDTHRDIFPTLDDVYKKNWLDLLTAQQDIMRWFDVPPARAAQILDEWRKTYPTRQNG